MPEVIKAIFGLEELSRIANNPHSVLNAVSVKPNATRVRLPFSHLVLTYSPASPEI